MVLKERVSNAGPRPFVVAVEAEIALVVASVAHAVLDDDQLFAVTAVVAVGVDHPALVDLLPAEQAAPVLADGVVRRRPLLVVSLIAVTFEDRAEVDTDDDPVDGGRAPGRSEDREERRVFSGLRQVAEHFQRLGIEDELFPLDALIGGVEQLVGHSLCLEVLDSRDDAAMVADVENVAAFQDLRQNSKQLKSLIINRSHIRLKSLKRHNSSFVD